MRAFALLSLLALVACTPDRRAEEDDTCDTPCAAACCASGEACLDGRCQRCERKTCADLGLGCGDANDGCGGALSCGTCAGGLTCGGGGSPGRCGKPGCTAETDAELCQAQGRNCGTLDVKDACGITRHVAACGTCTAPATCGGSGKAGVCGQPGETCVPESDRQLCTRLGHDCGPLEAFDNCDASRAVVSCGSCTSPKTCGGGGRSGACGCTGESNQQLCSAAGAQCGSITVKDRCDVTRTVECGTCSAPTTCGGAGQQNKCGCTGETDAQLCTANAATCGTISVRDRCNKSRSISCGSCTSPATCGGGGHANQCGCTGETDQVLCQRAGAVCGSLNVTDGCGATRRIASCGTCTSPDTCGGGGIANQCGCTSHKTDAQLCADNGYQCDSGSFTDECGDTRDVASCGTCTAPATCNTSWFQPHTCYCEPETDQELCTAANYACGTLTTKDKCGGTRTVDCGACSTSHTCNAQHQCFCQPETDAQLCARVGSDCGARTFTDNCGTSRSVNCGTCAGGLTCPSVGLRCTAWVKVTSPTSNDIGGIWGVGASEIYAVSDSETSTNPRALRWDGSTWTGSSKLVASPPGVSGFVLDRLTDVWAVPGAVFVAASGKDGAGKRWGVILKSNGGSTWSTFSVLTVQPGTFWNVRGTSATNVFAAMPGFNATSTAPAIPPRILRYDGSTWTDLPLPSTVAPDEMMQGLMPFSTAELFFTANSCDMLWRWNGSSVQSISAPHSGYFDTWGASPTDVWMTGTDGHLAQWNGSTVVDRSIPGESAWLYDVHGTGSSDVWFVGTHSFIGHWDGTQIVREYSPVTSWHNGVFANATDVWVVGDSGLILRRRR